ncbi:MAG: XkdX family protein [Clostridiales bacterium]|nr:XkdX family protein [Clostridiales bacterium]
MSRNFEKVKEYYQKGFWDLDMVKNSVNRWITESEFKEITEQEYIK